MQRREKDVKTNHRTEQLITKQLIQAIGICFFRYPNGLVLIVEGKGRDWKQLLPTITFWRVWGEAVGPLVVGPNVLSACDQVVFNHSTFVLQLTAEGTRCILNSEEKVTTLHWRVFFSVNGPWNLIRLKLFVALHLTQMNFSRHILREKPLEISSSCHLL